MSTVAGSMIDIIYDIVGTMPQELLCGMALSLLFTIISRRQSVDK